MAEPMLHPLAQRKPLRGLWGPDNAGFKSQLYFSIAEPLFSCF